MAARPGRLAVLIALVYNPGAGEGGIDLPALLGAVEGSGHRAEAWSTAESGWEQAFEGTHDVVVAAGGDGTVGKVFTALAGTGRVTTIVPLGTANNVARGLGLPVERPLKVIEGWATGSRRQFDVPGVVIDGVEQRFVEGTVGGVFAELLVRTERSDPHGTTSQVLWDRFGELLGTAYAEPWLIDLDGDAATVEVIGVHAMNIGYTGPAVPLAPQADPHDGLVDVLLIGPDDAAALERYARARRAGRPGSLPPLRTRRGRTVGLIPPSIHAALVVDDRIVGPTQIGPTTIDAAASTVPVLLPGP